VNAVVYEQYGPPEVLHIKDVGKPVPRDDEVLVKIHASTVNRLDCHTREANRGSGPAVMLLSRMVSGLRRPRQPILGSELAGEVVAVGSAVKEFAVGDLVFANTGLRFGAHAEYTCVPSAGRIAHMPRVATFDEAAAVSDGFLNALWCMRQGELRKDQSILVYGASGAIGTAGVQLARYFGADVTGVTTTKNLDLVRSLGAGKVIDYTTEDFTKNGETYDVIFDAVGKHSFARSKGSLKAGGRYLATDGMRNLALALWTPRFGNKRVIFSIPPRYTQEDMRLLKQLIEDGKYRAVIDRVYPLDQVVEATKYVETQQKVGNVVLKVE
jgi:NADPH:quinone reductase-like Zn-dependent oxidoreductase